jgi:hypothetical protein
MQFLQALVTVTVLGACSDPTPKPGDKPSPASPTPSSPTSAARVSFELDGVAAATAPRGGKDSDEHSGQISNMTDQLVLYFYGDAPAAPRRAFLSIVVKAFPRTAGEVPEANAILSRYATDDKGPQYHGKMKVVIKSFEPGPKNAMGKTWLASGTFEGDLPLQIGQQAAVAITKVTNGVFEGLPVQEIGKPR